MIVVASLGVQAIHAVTQQLASSRTMPSATTAMKAVATTANWPPMELYVVLRQEHVIPPRLAQELRLLALLIPTLPTARVAEMVCSVPVGSAQAVHSNAEASWVVTVELATTQRLATVLRARFGATVLHLAQTFALRFSKTF